MKGHKDKWVDRRRLARNWRMDGGWVCMTNGVVCGVTVDMGGLEATVSRDAFNSSQLPSLGL